VVKKMFSAILIVLVLWSAQESLFANEAIHKNKESELADDFNLSDLNNKKVSLSKLRGRSVVLFFWTTWCPFCRRELKALNNMYADLTKDGIELLAINIEEPAYKVDNFVKTNKFVFRVLLDKDMAVAESYEILGVPTYVLIDKKGHIVFEDHYFPQKEYKDLILQ